MMRVARVTAAVAGTLIAWCALDARSLSAQGADSSAMRIAAMPRRWVPARTSQAQLLQQTVSLHISGVPLADALEQLSRRAGLRLGYSGEVRQSRVRVSLISDSMTVLGALLRALDGTGFQPFVSLRGDAVLVSAAVPQPKSAPGTIVGRVADAKTGQPVAGAEVLLQGTRWRAAVDTTGQYQLADVDSGTYTLTARRLGYVRQSRKITAHPEGTDTADFALEPAAVALNELVTTATGRQRRRDIGNAITTIKADSVLRTAPIRNLTDLLAGRVPGLTVRHTSGAPGDPARLRLRGIGSVTRSNDPVVFVDGVRVYAAQSDARSGNLTNPLVDPGSGQLAPAPSPLDQIDPNTIERIDVFKGPSAATLYGADAANGVIVITTKKGKPGPALWDATFQYGRTRTLGRYPTGYYRWGHSPFYGFKSFCPLTHTDCIQDSLVQFQALNDPSLTVLGQGRRAEVSLAASGGTKNLTYHVTGSYANELGLLELPAFEVARFRAAFNRDAPDWMRRPHDLTNWSVRSNVTISLGPNADVALSSSLERTQQQRTSLENQLAPLAGTYIDTINQMYYRPAPGSGNYLQSTAAVLRDYYLRTTASSINFTTGLNANWRPKTWLNAHGDAGVNIIPRDDQTLLPAGLVSLTDSGSVSRATGQSIVGTFNVQGTVRRPLGWGFAFETNLGANLNTTSTGDIAAAASGLVPGTSMITGATHISAYDAQMSNSVFGWFVEPRITGQRLSLSMGLRLDGGSAYGARLNRGSGIGGLLALPKLGGAWVISEEPWFPFQSLFSSLKLRGAYGQAQVQPAPDSRLRLYKYSTDAEPSVVLTALGNTQLRPERSTEIEGGFDADLLDSRVSLEFAAYRKMQVDALMQVTLPASVGGGSSVWTNIGNIRNRGVELSLGVTPLRRPAVTWTAQLLYSANNNTLVKLGRGVSTNYANGIVAGYPVGSRWDRPIFGYSDANGDGVLQGNEIVLGDSAAFLGRLDPAYQMMLHSSLRLLNGALGVAAGFSYDAGASQVDQTARTNWVLSRALVDPTTPLSQQAAVVTASSNDPWLRTDYGVIQEISTFRFNSLSVNYRAPARIARVMHARELFVSLQGDNLALHSTYRGKDPDVNAWAPGEGVVDSGQLPRPTTWQLRFDLKF